MCCCDLVESAHEQPCSVGSGSSTSREQSACGKFSNCTFETFFSWFQRNFQDGECSDASKDVLPVLQGNQAVPSDQLQEFERRSDVKKTQVEMLMI